MLSLSLPEKLCLHCESVIARSTRMAREYCSDECYAERKRKLRKLAALPRCQICGNEFERRSNRQKFCSDGCKLKQTRNYSASYVAHNLEEIRKRRREYMGLARAADPEAFKRRDKEWRSRNREALNAKRRTPEYRTKKAAQLRERYKKEPRLVVHNRMASAVYQAIRSGKAGRKWETVVGYTLNELVRHLERQFLPGMTWKNMGKWHIDHIVPKASFEYETADDEGFRAAWAITNLRPLWAGKNQEKHAKRTHLL